MDINKYIDHTLLKATANESDFNQLVQVAKRYFFAAVIVPPTWVRQMRDALKDTGVAVGTVISFPFGYDCTDTKSEAVENAVLNGADEVDIVMNLSLFKSGNYQDVQRDLEEVVQVSQNRITKVIIETSYLNDEEIMKAAQLVRDSGAHFVKTSTGYGARDTTVHDIKLILQAVGKDLLIKASGGVRTLDQVKEMIDLGVSRIGTSTGPDILDEYQLLTEVPT